MCSPLVARWPAGRLAPGRRPPTPVSVSYPVEREVTNYADFTGRLEAVYSVEIRARVTGYLDRVYFKDGDEVNEGASLFEIDPRPYKVELDRAEASAAPGTRRTCERLEADHRRAANLFNRASDQPRGVRPDHRRPRRGRGGGAASPAPTATWPSSTSSSPRSAPRSAAC